jgi:hypothetical protein
LILFLINLKKNKKVNLKQNLYGILLFLIICFPFILNIKFTENNFSERVGVIQITWLDKEKIINYFFQKVSKFNIIIVSAFIITFLFYIKEKFKENYNIKVLLTLTFSSIVAPILFILFSGKISLLYHWTNSIIICFFIFCLCLLLNYISKKKVILFKGNIFYLLLFIYLILFSKTIYKNNFEKKYLDQNYNEIFNQINKIPNSNKLQTLAFDQKMTTWLITNNFTKLNLVSGLYTNYKNTDIDLNLIQAFKFLNLNSNDLVNFLKNEKKNWRYINKYVQNFYLYKYTANSLKTANNEFDFDNNEMNQFIKNTSPLHSQQLAIPQKDFKKLEKTFKETNLDRFNYPELIILDKENIILKKNNLDTSYCTIISNKSFELKIIKKYKNYCP